MGTLYSTARDPIFYDHHANVDRTWSVWKSHGSKWRDYSDKDFLNGGLLFQDENTQLVLVRVRDGLNEAQFRYTYQKVDIPWVEARPTPRRARVAAKKKRPAPAPGTEKVSFPLELNAAGKVKGGAAEEVEARQKKLDEERHLPESRHPMGGNSTHSPPSEGSCQEEEAWVGAGYGESELSFGAERGGEGDGDAAEEVEEQGGEGGAGGGRRRARQGRGGEVRRVRERGGGGGADGERVLRQLRERAAHEAREEGEEEEEDAQDMCEVGTEVLEDMEAEEDDELVVTIVPRMGEGLVCIGSVKIEFSD